MFVTLAELTLFLSIILWVTYHFKWQKNMADINSVPVKEVISDAIWTDYETLMINKKIDTKRDFMYEEYEFKFASWALGSDIDELTPWNQNICDILNSN